MANPVDFPKPNQLSRLVIESAPVDQVARDVAALIHANLFTQVGLALQAKRFTVLSREPETMAVKVELEIGGQGKAALEKMLTEGGRPNLGRAKMRVGDELSRLMALEFNRLGFGYQASVTVNKVLEGPGHTATVVLGWRGAAD